MALNPNIREVAKSAFEQKCFLLISEAYQASLTEKIIQLDWNENDISSEIHKHIHTNPLRQKWKVSTNLEAKTPKDLPKVKGFADKLPRIDFRFTTFSNYDEYEYFFEAKNLRQNDSALKRRYIDTGIDNFVSGRYSNGSLIGYLLEGDIHKTIEGVNTLLKKDNRHSEILQITTSKVVDVLYISNHASIGILKHLMLDFVKS
jgi:hypothetical protein